MSQVRILPTLLLLLLCTHVTVKVLAAPLEGSGSSDGSGVQSGSGSSEGSAPLEGSRSSEGSAPFEDSGSQKGSRLH